MPSSKDRNSVEPARSQEFPEAEVLFVDVLAIRALLFWGPYLGP